MLSYSGNKFGFNDRLEVSSLSDVIRRRSGSEFEAIGPATEKRLTAETGTTVTCRVQWVILYFLGVSTPNTFSSINHMVKQQIQMAES